MTWGDGISCPSYFGIHSKAAALLFTALYALCLPYYIFRSWNNRAYVLVFLAIFCLRPSPSSLPSLRLRSDIFVHSVVRVITFVMCGALVGRSGDNINLPVTKLFFYGVALFGLLPSAFILVNNRLVYLSHFLSYLITPSNSPASSLAGILLVGWPVKSVFSGSFYP